MISIMYCPFHLNLITNFSVEEGVAVGAVDLSPSSYCAEGYQSLITKLPPPPLSLRQPPLLKIIF